MSKKTYAVFRRSSTCSLELLEYDLVENKFPEAPHTLKDILTTKQNYDRLDIGNIIEIDENNKVVYVAKGINVKEEIVELVEKYPNLIRKLVGL